MGNRHAQADEWDTLSSVRSSLIRAGRDFTFTHLIQPIVLKFVQRLPDRSNILDAGCGTGELTEAFTGSCEQVTAIDSSKIAIELAQSVAAGRTRYIHTAIENTASYKAFGPFSGVVCSMVLMDTPNYQAAISALRSVMTPGARALFLLLHPAGYLYSRKIMNSKSDYWDESVFNIPYSIQGVDQDLNQKHYHRPVSNYFRAFRDAGFSIDGICEPTPPQKLRKKSPVDYSYPRLLGFECVASEPAQGYLV